MIKYAKTTGDLRKQKLQRLLEEALVIKISCSSCCKIRRSKLSRDEYYCKYREGSFDPILTNKSCEHWRPSSADIRTRMNRAKIYKNEIDDSQVVAVDRIFYTITRLKEDDTPYGPMHGAEPEEGGQPFLTLCGKKIDEHWYILTTRFGEGKVTCGACLRVLNLTSKEQQ